MKYVLDGYYLNGYTAECMETSRYTADGYVATGYIEEYFCNKDCYATQGYVQDGYYTCSTNTDEVCYVEDGYVAKGYFTCKGACSSNYVQDGYCASGYMECDNAHVVNRNIYVATQNSSIEIFALQTLWSENTQACPIQISISANQPIAKNIQNIHDVGTELNVDLNTLSVTTNSKITPTPENIVVSANQPNVQFGSTSTLSAMDLNIEAQPVTISHDAYLKQNVVDLILEANKQVITAEKELVVGDGIGGEVEEEPTVKAGIITLKIKSDYENATKNAYIYPHSNTVYITSNDLPIDTQINTGVIDIQANTNNAVAQPSQRRRVVKIGDIELAQSLYYNTLSIEKCYSTVAEATDTESVVSVLPIGKYGRGVQIGNNEIIKFDKVQDIINLVGEETVKIMFSDGYEEDMKFDLINTPLSITPLYDGSEYYNVKIRGLV